MSYHALYSRRPYCLFFIDEVSCALDNLLVMGMEDIILQVWNKEVASSAGFDGVRKRMFTSGRVDPGKRLHLLFNVFLMNFSCAFSHVMRISYL